MPRFPRVLATAIVVGIVGVLIATLIGGAVGTDFERLRQTRQLESDLSLRRALLRSEIERHRLLPVTLAGDAHLWRAVDPSLPDSQKFSISLALSSRFEQLARSDGAATLYLVDIHGTTVASSNYQSKESFVGQNYSFRSYFSDAAAKGSGELFARGTVSRIPGLYLAHRLDDRSGVVVVKVEFDEIERSWRATGDGTFVTDEDGQILLTSEAASRFSHLEALTPGTGARLIEAGAALGSPNWRVTIRRDISRQVLTSRFVGWFAGGTLGGLVALIFGTALVTRERRERNRAELESLVATRTTELRTSNDQLMREIDERTRADARAQRLRDDLAQANRLAVLGQISAGVAHEINQPVSAIRTNVDNARVLLKRGRNDETLQSLGTIAALTDRIGVITDELREFSKRTPLERKPTRLAAAIDGACVLLDPPLRAARITLRRNLSPADPQILANRTKVEQVVVNLLQNAIEALVGTSLPVITVETGEDASQAWLAIADNGPGVPESILGALFTPFSTSKPLGLGLGLIISRDIVSDLGGTLNHEAAAGGGARFVAKFPRGSSL